MPDRELRFAAMLDVVEVACGAKPKVLDLAGGTGSITRRVLARFPQAESVLVDLDPALLALAARTFEGDARVQVVSADLARPTWRQTLPTRGNFDAVLSATALHWLDAPRVAALYAEAFDLLAPGGILANADHMPDEGLAVLDDGFESLSAERAASHRAVNGSSDWDGWWEELAGEPEMAPLVEARHAVYGGQAGSHTRSTSSSAWHEQALRDAGFRSAGIAWRTLGDAMVVGVR